MTYKVELVHSEEGYSVGCPELPGCYSQGETEEEAIANIKSAISGYLSVVKERKADEGIEKKILFIDVAEAVATGHTPSLQTRPFKVVPLPMSIPHFTKVEDLLDTLEGLDRR